MHPSILASLAGVLVFGAASASAAGPLLDYRDEAFVMGSPFYAEAERRMVADALKRAAAERAARFGDAFAILGHAHGAFTSSEAAERIYLVQAGPPSAIEPFPDGPAPLLVVFDRQGRATLFGLPEGVQYQRLVAAADGDGDGRAEILLETTVMNMGQSVTSLDVVRLSDEGAGVVDETLSPVLFDGCENPAGERVRSASAIEVGDEGFVVTRFEGACD